MNDTTPALSPWQSFLAEQGIHCDDTGRAIAPGTPVTDNWIAPLTDMGLLHFAGDDAVTFLHSQLTNDVQHLAQDKAMLAGYCTAKGRLLATFLVWHAGNGLCLQLPTDIIGPIHKRLQMFVLRAKVTVSRADPDTVMLGLAGTQAATVLQQYFDTLPANEYDKSASEHGTLVRLPSGNGQPRFLLATPETTARTLWPVLTASLPVVSTSQWHLSGITAGIPQVTKATQEQFVPQMINFELIGGVNFRKGCYPGQEIVARSQYLGKVKRRMLLATVAAEVQAGQDIYSSEDPGQPCGMIVNAATGADGMSSVLAEIKLAATASGTVHLGSAEGPVLAFTALPYSLESED